MHNYKLNMPSAREAMAYVPQYVRGCREGSHPRGRLAEGGQEPPGVVEVGQAAGAERGMDVAARDGDDPSKQTGASPSIPVLFPCIPRPDVLSPIRVPPPHSRHASPTRSLRKGMDGRRNSTVCAV